MNRLKNYLATHTQQSALIYAGNSINFGTNYFQPKLRQQLWNFGFNFKCLYFILRLHGQFFLLFLYDSLYFLVKPDISFVFIHYLTRVGREIGEKL